MEVQNKRKSYKHKSHYCIYCKTEIKRIHEHFIRFHKNEIKVQEILCGIRDKSERFWKWKRLTQEGDNYFNSLLEDSSDKKKVVKELVNKSVKKKYFTCERCLGRLRTCSRAQHQKVCHKILGEQEDSCSDVFDGAPEYIINRIRASNYLVQFLTQIYEEKGKTLKKLIRTMMRDLIAVEDEIRKKHRMSEGHLITFVKLNEVDNFIEIIKKRSKEEKLDGFVGFRYPFRAQRLCRLMNRLAKYLVNVYYKKNMNEEALEISKFINIFNVESEVLIKNQAYRTIRLRKVKNPQELPKTTDINALVKKLRNETPKLISLLENNKNSKSWRELAENILCRVTIFNRRRGGAVEKLKVSEYTCTDVKSKTVTEEALFNLSQDEKTFLNRIRIIEIVHKCGNVVPIHITEELQEGMQSLFLHRDRAGINVNNPYFFAAGRMSLNPISCVKVLEKYRQWLPTNVQKLFTATNLRKHGATIAQILDLTNQDSEEWANHLGHSLQVHKEYYRRQELVNSILKTGRILKTLDEGTIKYYKGKKIKEIPLGTIEDFTGAQGSDSDFTCADAKLSRQKNTKHFEEGTSISLTDGRNKQADAKRKCRTKPDSNSISYRVKKRRRN